MSKTDTQYQINESACFNDDNLASTLPLREYLFKRFSNQISLLLESKRPRKCYSTKGRLSPRKLYQFPFNDSIFTQSNNIPSSDTTIIMLIDASSSMRNNAFMWNSKHYDCIEVASAITSAFAKAVRVCVKDEIKLEVFLKTCSNSNVLGSLGINGAPVELVRIYSNTKRKDCDLDKILTAECNSPLSEKDTYNSGSATPEYAVLPALFQWIKENVETKNICIFNMTDGDTFSRIGKNRHFGNQQTQIMREKYLRHVDNITLYIGKEISESDKQIYGENVIGNTKGDETSFIQPMFNTLMKIFNNSTS